MNGILEFYYITSNQYSNIVTPDPDALYFLSDTYSLYKGDKLYNGGVKIVASLPESPALGTLYILSTTWVGQVWTGTAWKIITKPFDEVINSSATNANVPTSKAVYDYIQDITNETFITNIAYDVVNGYLDIEKLSNGVPTQIAGPQLQGVVHNASYNSSTRVVNLPIFNGTTVTFTLPKDQDLVVKAGKYNAATEEIWLSIDPTGVYTNASNVIKIPVSNLIDEISVANSNTIELSYDTTNNQITANAVISSVANNALSDNSGLYVDISGKLDTNVMNANATFAELATNQLVTKGQVHAVFNAVNTSISNAESNISNNTSNISNNAANISNNSNSIANNAANISNNTNSIANLSNSITNLSNGLSWKTTT